MVIRTPSRRTWLRASALVFMLAAGVEMSVATLQHSSQNAAPVMAQAGPLAVLTESDRSLYRLAFGLQREGRFAEADATLSRVANPLLKATVLAERYLNKTYTPKYSELTAWLDVNADAPKAEEVYHLAMANKPAMASAPEEPILSRKLKGFTSGYARSKLYENKGWQAGIASYRRKDMEAAARQFTMLVETQQGNLSTDDRAAAAFWAYRALKAQGNAKQAAHYLEMASDMQPGFYSLLARRLTGENHTVTAAANQTDENLLLPLMDQAPVRRAVALTEIGEKTLAENELRAIYPRADKATRAKLLAFARRLDMPAAQMRMAENGGSASFPVPNWEPTAGYRVERALLLAIMRQESGFNPNAKSPSGALGLMQLMPATAHAMAGEERQLGKSNLDPAFNMTLGQRYVEHLMEIPRIGDNLIYITAAYNAGPGNIINWLGKGEKDPLLFVETIPVAQTRDYVVHVMANYWIYSQMFGQNRPASLMALAGGNWPRYDGAERQLVAMLSRAD